MLQIIHRHGQRFADIVPTWEIPRIWKARTLGRFHGMNPTPPILQHTALMIQLFDDGEPLAICPQARVFPNEILLAQPQIYRDRQDIGILNPHIARPFAAGIATLANIMHVRLKHRLVIQGTAM